VVDQVRGGALQCEIDANSSGSVVRKSNHQFGWHRAVEEGLEVSAGGIVMPLRTSRSRAPATGTFHGQDQRRVTGRVDRWSSSLPGPWSDQM